MYRKILVPLDGSTFAEAALPIAVALTRRAGADLHVVTVQEPVPSFAFDAWEQAAGEWCEEYLSRTAERLRGEAGAGVTVALLAGPVAQRLEEEADRSGADLVVMASHGRGLLTRAWLGSVADAFLHVTTRPVLIARPDGNTDDDEGTSASRDVQYRRVLVPLNGSRLSECMLEHALEFGRLFDAAYHLVRVVPYPIDVASPYVPHTVQLNQELVEDAKAAAQEYLGGHAQRLQAEGLEVTTRVVVDAQPGHGILKEVEASDCDLVAMSTHGRTGLSRAILGSAADKVVRGARVPVLLYRPPPED